jgi:hypothetical protein
MAPIITNTTTTAMIIYKVGIRNLLFYRILFGFWVVKNNAGYEFIVHQTFPGHILRVGSVCLRQLGEDLVLAFPMRGYGRWLHREEESQVGTGPWEPSIRVDLEHSCQLPGD